MGAEGFVEQFVPQTTWPKPRSVSPKIYRVAMESLQDTPVPRPDEQELEYEEEDPVFMRQTRQHKE